MENRYCIYCGAQNTRQAKFCVKCGKEMEPKENLLIDFLLKRTKDKFKGSAEDSLYEAIKNFLLSHLYGVMLTISFISAVVTTAYAGVSDVKQMTNEEVMAYLETFEHNTVVNENTDSNVYSDEYNRAIHNLASDYEMEATSSILTDAVGNYIRPNPDKYRLPASYGYGGVHHLDTSVPTFIDGVGANGVLNRTEFDVKYFQTDIANLLYKDGYKVGECVVEREFEIDGEIVASYSYILVAVLVDGEWKVAEDRMLTKNYDPVQSEQQISANVDTSAAYDVASEYVDRISNLEDASELLMSDSLGYNTQHQLVYDEYLLFVPDVTDRETICTTIEDREYYTNNASKQLADDGYTVVEFLLHQEFYDIPSYYTLKGERDVYVTCVYIDGRWYVAEDTVPNISHYDVNKYDEEQQEVIINIDNVSEFANEYANLIFTGNDASHLNVSSDFGYETEKPLVYNPQLDLAIVEKSREYAVYTVADGFENDATTLLVNSGYTAAEYWAREEYTSLSTGEVVGYNEFRITCVMIDGYWYVAQDVMVASEVY